RRKPAIEACVEVAVSKYRDAIGKEDGRGVAARLFQTFVSEADALPPAEPMARPACACARDLNARLAAKRTQHHREPASHLRKPDRVNIVNRLARGAADHPVPGTADRPLQFQE